MGRIFDIKRYAIHDGPGVRVTVFLKGCPLRCAWCHNPEGISPEPQLSYLDSKCIGCGECEKVCPHDACKLTPDGVVIDKEKCVLCGACVRACPTLALEMIGEDKTVKEILDEVEKDRILIDQSGGGVTFSGGEPTRQADFLIELLDAAARRGLHRTVDTTGHVPTETLLEVAKHADMFLFDLKLFEGERHKKWTGVDNKLIQKNLKALAETGVEIEIRIPLIDGVNSDEENIEAAAKLVASLAGDPKKVKLLPYHDIAGAKYKKLGVDYELPGVDTPSDEDIERIIEQFAKHGVTAVSG